MSTSLYLHQHSPRFPLTLDQTNVNTSQLTFLCPVLSTQLKTKPNHAISLLQKTQSGSLCSQAETKVWFLLCLSLHTKFMFSHFRQNKQAFVLEATLASGCDCGRFPFETSTLKAPFVSEKRQRQWRPVLPKLSMVRGQVFWLVLLDIIFI